jgi:adenylate cyclase
MFTEIERRFLVPSIAEIELSKFEKFDIIQSYIETKGLVTRVRTFGTSAYLTMKGPKVDGACDEFEYAIPYEHAVVLAEKYCDRVIKKSRYIIPNGSSTIELDVFHGHLEGLVIAEIELDSIDEDVELPKWLGQEITDDHNYSNYNLAARK